MKPVYAVKVGDDNIVAVFSEANSAYQLREKKQDELPDSCHVHVDKHVLYKDLSDRENVRS